jgi:hypothetical protein
VLTAAAAASTVIMAPYPMYCSAKSNTASMSSTSARPPQTALGRPPAPRVHPSSGGRIDRLRSGGSPVTPSRLVHALGRVRFGMNVG